jgi:hypothetical protein
MRCRKSADARSPMCNPPHEIRTTLLQGKKPGTENYLDGMQVILVNIESE